MAQAITNEDLAYAAGIIDGEGCILVNVTGPDKKRGRKSPSTVLQVKVSMTDVVVISWLQKTFGGYLNSHVQRNRSRPVYNWGLVSKNAAEFCRMIRPWLKLKGGQADLAMEMYEVEWKVGGGKVTPPDELARRRRISDDIKALNQRRA